MKGSISREELFALSLKAADKGIPTQIKKNWDALAKPIDALGELEELICRIGAIQGTERPVLKKRSLLVFCSDNGIVREGVTQTGAEVTRQVAGLLGAGRSTANILAAHCGADCIPVDVGIDSEGEIPGVMMRKIRRGSRDFLKEAAMTKEETLSAISCGMELAEKLAGEGADILLTGEMGIGNTTTATTMLCLLCGKSAEEMTGRGAGLDDEGLERKRSVIGRALELYGKESYTDDKERAFCRLRETGGYDIAAMCGVFIGGALCSVPVVIDGLISAVAALCAELLLPGCREYMLASHSGRERGVKTVLERLGLKAVLDGNMALGEGTGALLLLPLLDAALDYYNKGTDFSQGGIKEYRRYS